MLQSGSSAQCPHGWTLPERRVKDSAARRRTNAAWLRAQLEGLRFAAAVREIPHHEWKQAMERIVRGEDWRVTL
jgi:hypothetical protein